MSTHLLPALFSCRKHHGICGYVAPILDQKGVRTRGVSYLYLSTYIWFIFMVNVGKYTNPMDPMQYE